jgi:hypothetical protein
MEYGDFSVEEIEELFEHTAFEDLVKSNNQLKDSESRRKLLRAINNKNITVKHSEDRFSFTPAYNVFIDFAKDLANKSQIIL